MSETGDKVENASKDNVEEVKKDDASEEASENQEPQMSKRAMKRLAKRQRWLDTKSERRAMEKAKKKAKMERLRAENKISGSYTEFRKRVKAEDKVKSDIKIVFDMSFGDVMNQKDCGKSLKQLLRCYSFNRRLETPMQMYVTGLKGQCETEMERHEGYKNWDCKFSSEDFTEVFKEMPKDKIVYLTSESDNVLGDKLESDCVYIIGGLVDHNSQKGLCHKLAQEKEINHARIPIAENIDMKTRKVLTIDHVFTILAGVAVQNKSWKEILLETLPKRKGAKEKDDVEDEEDNDS